MCNFFSKLLKRSRLFFTVFVISIGPIVGGVALGFSSSVSAQLLLPEIILATFSSIINLGALLGTIFVGPLIEHKGLRFTLASSTCPTFIGWFLIFLAQGLVPPSPPSVHLIASLLLGRILTGIGCGMLLTTGSIYLVDVAPLAHRGRLGSVCQMGVVAGICVSYCFGMYGTWFTTAQLMLLPTMLLTFLCFLLPESPSWLLKNGRRQSALYQLSWLRGDKIQANQELSSYSPCDSSETNKKLPHSLISLLLPCINIPLELRPNLLMAVYLMIFQQLTGVNVITFYTEPICQQFVPISQSPQCAFLLGLSQVVFALIACFLIDRFPRRMLVVSTGVITAVSMFLFALAQQFPNQTPVSPMTSLIFFLFGYNCGWGPLPMLITLELFPVSQRGTAGVTAGAISWFIAFLVTQLFKTVEHIIGTFLSFILFSVFTLCGSFFFFHNLPETNQAFLNPRTISIHKV